MRPQDSTGSQRVKVGEAEAGQGVEKVGLGGADLRGSLRAGAKTAADCHRGMTQTRQKPATG